MSTSKLSGLIISLTLTLIAAETINPKPKPKLWSLQPVRRPIVPQGLTRSTNPIDAFLAAKHKENKLTPVGQADKLTLLRRLSFDLTGLPPTPVDQDALGKGLASAVDQLVETVTRIVRHETRAGR